MNADQFLTPAQLENKCEGRCVFCGLPFTDENVFTEAGWRETRISQICEKCFDEMFEEK